MNPLIFIQLLEINPKLTVYAKVPSTLSINYFYLITNF